VAGRDGKLLMAGIAILIVGCTVALAAAPFATSAREPTASERQALQRAVNSFEGVKVRIASVRVSTVSPAWARVVEGGVGTSNDDLLLQLRGGLWTVRNIVSIGAPPDGGCAYAPAAVVHDLYKITCPPPRALHARRATSAESAALLTVFRHDPLTRKVRGAPGLHLAHTCVSRLDTRWAGAIAEFPDTGMVVWFHKTQSGWHVARFDRSGTLPPRAIILSLASCVGYSAAQYGA
jgi:hypothetical protein